MSGTASAQQRSQRDVPCAGCLTYVPASYAPAHPAPLLVILHGDGGSPEEVAALFGKGAERRGWLRLALRCPRAEGCRTGSFWQWAGPASWIDLQVEAVGRTYALDRDRIYLFAWSGGASYVTWKIADMSPRFAAISLTGGGIPPDGGCAPCRAPVLWLAGDRNPLLHLALRARDALRACGHEVTWHVLPGRDHAGEWAALRGGEAEAILDFLSGHRNHCGRR